MTHRRSFLKGAFALSATLAMRAGSAAEAHSIHWVSTTARAPWHRMSGIDVSPATGTPFGHHVEILPGNTFQTIRGFGGSFSEKGWLALQTLPPAAREDVLDALFLAGKGASFSMGRTPIGANDISRGWYSYDETDGDFALSTFSVANDRDTLIPFIRAALKRRPDMTLWASPWSPPNWMKTNRHYAMTPAWPGQPTNGLAPSQQGQEGRDYFILEPAYLEAYARYFRRYVEEYAREGIRIATVMPQNEFNSAQPFPSCCWTPAGLAKFIPYLAREVGPLGVNVFFGTLERGNATLLDAVLKDPEAGQLIRGAGLQWAGHSALPEIRAHHPELELWQSEQECGVGTNDWHYARYSWGRMKEYFQGGVSAWFYWNLVMPTGGMSGWGWPQNALVTVDAARGHWSFNHDYYLLAHASHFIAPGAKRIETTSYTGYENQLAFRNPDGAVVVLVQNEMADPMTIRMKLGDRIIGARLPADSFNTLVLPASLA